MSTRVQKLTHDKSPQYVVKLASGGRSCSLYVGSKTKMKELAKALSAKDCTEHTLVLGQEILAMKVLSHAYGWPGREWPTGLLWRAEEEVIRSAAVWVPTELSFPTATEGKDGFVIQGKTTPMNQPISYAIVESIEQRGVRVILTLQRTKPHYWEAIHIHLKDEAYAIDLAADLEKESVHVLTLNHAVRGILLVGTDEKGATKLMTRGAEQFTKYLRAQLQNVQQGQA